MAWMDSHLLFRRITVWIRSMQERCSSSAAEEATGSKGCFGKETDFCCYISVYLMESFSGQGPLRKWNRWMKNSFANWCPALRSSHRSKKPAPSTFCKKVFHKMQNWNTHRNLPIWIERSQDRKSEAFQGWSTGGFYSGLYACLSAENCCFEALFSAWVFHNFGLLKALVLLVIHKAWAWMNSRNRNWTSFPKKSS